MTEAQDSARKNLELQKQQHVQMVQELTRGKSATHATELNTLCQRSAAEIEAERRKAESKTADLELNLQERQQDTLQILKNHKDTEQRLLQHKSDLAAKNRELDTWMVSEGARRSKLESEIKVLRFLGREWMEVGARTCRLYEKTAAAIDTTASNIPHSPLSTRLTTPTDRRWKDQGELERMPGQQEEKEWQGSPLEQEQEQDQPRDATKGAQEKGRPKGKGRKTAKGRSSP